MSSHSSRKATLFACLIGNTLEWYDFVLYALFAKIIADLFFPQDIPSLALLSSFGIFAVGYLTRPLGGILIGHIGDKVSRKKALVLTIVTMGVATLCVGLLPTYHTWGIAAAIVLTLLRMIQGLGVGGEYPGSMVILVETANKHHKAFIGSLALLGAICGTLLATCISFMLSHWLSSAAFHAWGWRIPFLLGFVLALLGVYIRLSLWQQSTQIQYAFAQIPLILLFKLHWKTLLRAIAILSFTGVYTGVNMIFIFTYLHQYLGFSVQTTYLLDVLFTILLAVAYISFARITDIHQRYYPWMRIFMVLNIVLSYPLFILLTHGGTLTLVSLSLLILLGAITQSPVIKIITELFPPEVRYTGTGLSLGLAMSIFAGTAPLVLLILIKHFGLTAPAFYLMLAALLALLGLSKSPSQ